MIQWHSELCHWSHLKPNYHDSKIKHKYIEILEILSHYGYFIGCYDFQKLAKEKRIQPISNREITYNHTSLSHPPICKGLITMNYYRKIKFEKETKIK